MFIFFFNFQIKKLQLKLNFVTVPSNSIKVNKSFTTHKLLARCIIKLFTIFLNWNKQKSKKLLVFFIMY